MSAAAIHQKLGFIPCRKTEHFENNADNQWPDPASAVIDGLAKVQDQSEAKDDSEYDRRGL